MAESKALNSRWNGILNLSKKRINTGSLCSDFKLSFRFKDTLKRRWIYTLIIWLKESCRYTESQIHQNFKEFSTLGDFFEVLMNSCKKWIAKTCSMAFNLPQLSHKDGHVMGWVRGCALNRFESVNSSPQHGWYSTVRFKASSYLYTYIDTIKYKTLKDVCRALWNINYV
jgi:hypothetical protein